MVTVKLKKPIEHDGAKYEAINLDLDKLTGADVLFCEREANTESGGMPALARVLSADWQLQIAARACGLPPDVLKRLDSYAFMEALTAVQNFYMRLG